MTNQAAPPSSGGDWEVKQVYVMAAVCLVVGLALGYFFRGSQPPAAQVAGRDASASDGSVGGTGAQIPTLDQMKHMADVQAQPLLDKLKTDSANPDLLIQIGNVYRSAHQFQEAAEYYEKSLRISPKNVTIRTEMASCLYYAGNVDAALAQLEQSLKDDPKNANVLFNLGVIRWDAKKDKEGAVAAWRQLLKSNPTLDAAKKAAVEKMIAEAIKAGNKS